MHPAGLSSASALPLSVPSSLHDPPTVQSGCMHGRLLHMGSHSCWQKKSGNSKKVSLGGGISCSGKMTEYICLGQGESQSEEGREVTGMQQAFINFRRPLRGAERTSHQVRSGRVRQELHQSLTKVDQKRQSPEIIRKLVLSIGQFVLSKQSQKSLPRAGKVVTGENALKVCQCGGTDSPRNNFR